MDALAQRTGRHYRLIEYSGAPDAERVVVVMGSGAETAEHTVEDLVRRGEKVGVVKVRLYRPFPVADFLAAVPASVRHIAVLDRTKEPGGPGEPLYLDVLAALAQGDRCVRVIGGRYGLASKEFTPGMVRAVFAELGPGTTAPPVHRGHPRRRHSPQPRLEGRTRRGIREPQAGRLLGLGSDGTVGANKNTIKIIAEATDLNVQGYFVYDSKKAGARTISHLRFGSEPIRSPYLIQEADFIGVHQFSFLAKFDTLSNAAEGATLLLNSPHDPEEVWDRLPSTVQEQILARHLKLHVIDAYGLAQSFNLGMRDQHHHAGRLLPALPSDRARRKPCASCGKAWPTATANAARRSSMPISRRSMPVGKARGRFRLPAASPRPRDPTARPAAPQSSFTPSPFPFCVARAMPFR